MIYVSRTMLEIKSELIAMLKNERRREKKGASFRGVFLSTNCFLGAVPIDWNSFSSL
jgi:hypothetical protein